MPMNNKLIVDCRIGQDSQNALINLGYELIRIPESAKFEAAVCAHADMFCAKVKDKWFVDITVAHMFDYSEKVAINRATADGQAFKYPKDVGFNCAVVGNNLICNVKFTIPQIISYANEQNMNILNVSQGYAKCSTCIVDNNSIITEDESIAKTAGENGIDVLLIKKGFVKLFGYDYGFIGGASGLIENNLLAFNGDIKKHPSYDDISKFCSDRNVKIVCLCHDELYDVGSIFRV